MFPRLLGNRVRRLTPGSHLAAAVIFSAAAAMALVTTVVLPAQAAPAGGTVGDPQPELAPFRVGPPGGDGSGTVLPDGTLVLAALSTSGTTINVCVLHPGARKCASTSSLPAHSGDSFSGFPQVLASGGQHVSVVSEDCCNISDAVTFYSSNDGRTFSGETIAGTIQSVGAGTVADGQLVVGSADATAFNVQAFPPDPSSAEGSLATPNSAEDYDTSLTTYNGGLLAANDDTTNTRVEFAASGSDFNSSGSYHSVGVFDDETTVAVSGNALLTALSLTGDDDLRFFDGTSFSPAHAVPRAAGLDSGYFTIQDVGGTIYVFFEARRDGYDLCAQTTRNGARWSSLQCYASAIDSEDPIAVLNGKGAGVVYEADSPDALLAQPILDPQRVHISLRRMKLSGTASPHLRGQLVTLEVLKGKRWYAVKTTHESSAGKFSFTVPGAAHTYRAVVADEAGYYLYGYSNSVTLRA